MQITIIGAGRMGQGIARSFAQAGHDVALMDQQLETATLAAQRVQEAVPDADVKATDTPAGDLVIEAVFEDLILKRELLADVSRQLGPETLIATNTSSFRVADMAPYVAHPERFLAMHFFFPAHKNPLLEIAPGEHTGAEYLARALEIGGDIGKTVIQVKDSPGFAVNRFLLRWANEALRMVDEGLPRDVAEASGAAAVELPYGPFALVDMSGAVVCRHAIETLQAAFGPAFTPPSCLDGVTEPLRVQAGTPDAAATQRIRAAMLETVQEIIDEGVASLEDMDTAARVGLAWPHGPSKWLRAG